MKEKTAIVTGGGRGIGRAISIALAAGGYYVIVNYKSNESAAAETLAQIREAGGEGKIVAFDVSDSNATQAAMKEITKNFEIEVLINNAGITADGLFIMMPEKDWHSVVDTALNGFYNVTRPVLKQMLRKKEDPLFPLPRLPDSSVTGGRRTIRLPKPESLPRADPFPPKSPGWAFASMLLRPV